MAGLETIPGLSSEMVRSLRRRKITKRQLETRVEKAKSGVPDEIVDRLPIQARSTLEFKPEVRFTLATGQRLGERLRTFLRCHTSRCAAYIVGSARREKPFLKDLDILVVVKDSAVDSRTILESLHIHPSGARSVRIMDSYSRGPRRRSTIIRFGGKKYRVDFFLAFESELPYALYHHTGSSQYNIRIRAHAKARGWKLNQYGLFEQGTEKRVRGSGRIKTEADLAKFLGVTYRPPANRVR